MKKVVLFYPAVKFGGAVQPRTELPLSVLTVATPLDRTGYRVAIVDQRIEPNWRTRLTDELRSGPVCLGVSAMTGPQIRFGLEASRLARSLGQIPIVWGGIHPTLLPEQTLADPNVDIVVQGEGEETFLDLVRVLEEGGPLSTVKGIWFKEEGAVRHTERRPPIDLNAQPPLAYHLLDVNQYRVQLFGRGHLTFETSRGCAFRCSYCYNTKVYDSTWRSLTPDETITRLKRLVNETGAKGIIFSDDNFFGNKDRALEILRRIKEENLDISLPKVDGHISVLAQLKDSELQMMLESGCRMVQIGVESVAPRMQELLNKNFSVSDLAEFNRRLAKFDIFPAYYFMVGYPTETIEEIAQTMSFFLRLPKENKNAVPRLNIYTPFPGTGMYEHCVKNGFRPPESLEGWVSLNYRTVGRRSPWITAERRKVLRMLDFTAMLASRNNFINSYKQTGPLVKMVAALYYPIAKWRVEKLRHQFPVERKIAEYLGLYPKQNAAE